MLGLTIFVRPEDKNTASIYGQDIELIMTESHMYLQDIKSSPSRTGHNSNISVSSIRLNMLTKSTWKLKTPRGVLVFRVLVQVITMSDTIAIFMI